MHGTFGMNEEWNNNAKKQRGAACADPASTRQHKQGRAYTGQFRSVGKSEGRWQMQRQVLVAELRLY
jgi:hypothetical protein